MIFIIGITGVGKSYIGKILAKQIKYDFIDLDDQIELMCGVSIKSIFEIEGEKNFRIRETQELNKTVLLQKELVISIGGGCILSHENRKLISKYPAIQLTANIDILCSRISKSITKRPLFNNCNIRNKIIELQTQRCNLYNEVSNYILDTSNLSSKTIVNNIIEFLDKNKYITR